MDTQTLAKSELLPRDMGQVEGQCPFGVCLFRFKVATAARFGNQPCCREDVCLSVCLSALHVCEYVYTYMYVCVQRVEVDVWYLPPFLSTLCFWVRPFTELRAHRISHIGFWSNLRDPPASTSPALGRPACSLHQAFLEDLQYDVFLVKSSCYHPPNVEKLFYSNSISPGLSTDYV